MDVNPNFQQGASASAEGLQLPKPDVIYAESGDESSMQSDAPPMDDEEVGPDGVEHTEAGDGVDDDEDVNEDIETPIVVKPASAIKVRRPLIPFTLRQKIFCGFLCPLICGVILMAVITTAIVAGFASTWVAPTKDTMLSEELQQMDLTSKDNAILVNDYMGSISGDMNIAYDYIQDWIDGKLDLSNFTAWNFDCGLCARTGQTSAAGCSRPSYQIPSDSLHTSRYVSTYFDPESSTTTIDSEGIKLRNESGVIDFVFRPLHVASQPHYPNVYFGFEHRGIYRTYPYKDCREYYDMTPYLCHSTSSTTTKYDPRCRIWYDQAKKASPQGSLIFTPPYLDASTQLLLVTAAQAQYNKTDGSLVGVLGIDFSISSIETAVLQATMLDGGHSFVINSDGYAIVHRNMDLSKDKQSVCELEIEDTCRGDFGDMVTRMRNLQSGSGTFKNADDKLYYMSYSPVENGNFSVAVVFPEDSVLEKTRKATRGVYIAVGVQSLLFILIIITFSIVALTLTMVVTANIIRPISKLSSFIDKIIKGDFDKEIPSVQTGSKELTQLYDTFKGLMTALKIGNREFIGGNLKVAFHAYKNALVLFEKLHHEKGIAICHNNMGNVHIAVMEYDQARTEFNIAIDIGNTLIAKLEEKELEAQRNPWVAPKKKLKHSKTKTKTKKTIDVNSIEMQENPQPAATKQQPSAKKSKGLTLKEAKELRALRVSVASRINNLAMAHMAEGSYDSALPILYQALDIDKLTRNAVGFSTHVGNLGKIFMKQNNYSEAKEAFEEALLMAEDTGDIVAKEYALLNLGIYDRDMQNLETSLYWFQLALTCGPVLDQAVHIECLKQMHGLYRQLGENDIASRVKTLSEPLQTGSPRHFCFLLDISTSMEGNRLNRSVDNLQLIFREHMYDRDYCSVSTFCHRVESVFGMQQKSAGKEYMDKQINGIRTAKGGTAFWNALQHGYEELQDSVRNFPNDEHWIVALTDGEDQHSSQFAPFAKESTIRELARANYTQINLIVVSVGLLQTEAQLRSICKYTAKGKFVRCDDSQGVEAIDKAFEEVISQFSAGKLDLQDF